MNTIPTAMYDTTVSTFASVHAHSIALQREHAEEMAHYPHLMPADPDVARYQALEDAGVLRCLLLWLDERVVGYAISIRTNHPHHRDLQMLVNDTIFVSAVHRKGMAGVKLINRLKRLGKEEGAQLVTFTAQPDTPLEALLEAMRAKKMNTTFGIEV